jgi:hypothetical protein
MKKLINNMYDIVNEWDEEVFNAILMSNILVNSAIIIFLFTLLNLWFWLCLTITIWVIGIPVVRLITTSLIKHNVQRMKLVGESECIIMLKAGDIYHWSNNVVSIFWIWYFSSMYICLFVCVFPVLVWRTLFNNNDSAVIFKELQKLESNNLLDTIQAGPNGYRSVLKGK